MNKILIVGPSPHMLTGYGIVGKYLIEGLIKNELNVKFMGLQTQGKPYNDYELPYIEDLDYYINRYEITHILTIGDFIPKFEKKEGLKWIHHATVQNYPLPRVIKDKIKGADVLISPSPFVQRMLSNSGLKSTLIPHAFTLPITNKERPDILKDKKIFLCVGTNQIQKNIVTVIEAFRKILSRIENVVLILITNPFEQGGLDLHKIFQNLNFPPNSVFFYQGKYGYSLTREELAGIYSFSNIYVSASMGESFSLPLLEASFYGLPAIVPEFSASGDFVETYERGLTIRTKLMQTNYSLSKQALIDSNDLANTMIKIVHTKKIKFNSKDFELDNVLTKWLQIFK